MICLISVYLNHEESIPYLYELLKERDMTHAISHKKMPTYDEHRAFVYSVPYTAWYLVVGKEGMVGSIYLSKQREIGVFIEKKHQGHGYGTQAIERLIAAHPGRMLANINPSNTRSKDLFIKLGFRKIQETYEKQTDDSR